MVPVPVESGRGLAVSEPWKILRARFWGRGAAEHAAVMAPGLENSAGWKLKLIWKKADLLCHLGMRTALFALPT